LEFFFVVDLIVKNDVCNTEAFGTVTAEKKLRLKDV
jgi:hypothetical protein